MDQLRCLAGPLLVVVLLTQVQGECPQGFPEQCRCGKATVRVVDEVLEFQSSAVVCSGSPGLVSDEFLGQLPLDTEALVIQDTDLDSLPEGRLLFGDVQNHVGTKLRVLVIRDVGDGGERLDLSTLLCVFPRLEVLQLTNASVATGRLRVTAPNCAPRLRTLDLRDNIARYLPETTVRWFRRRDGRLRVLLDGNRFSCDCNLHALHEWLLSQPEADTRGNYTCTDGYPESLAGRNLMDLTPRELKCSDESPAAAVAEDRAAMRGLYLAAGALGAVAAAVALFALYLHFPVFELFGYGCRKPEPPLLSQHKPTGLRRKQYSSLPSLHNETTA